MILLIGFIICFSLLMFLNIKKANKKGGVTKIATWNFKDNMNKTVATKFSLADTITSSNTQIDKGFIAPGTSGSFDIIINAKGSNVNIEYEVNLISEVNTPNNIYFFTQKTSGQEKYESLKELFQKNKLSGSFKVDDKKEKVYTIFWEWPYETYNEDGSINEKADEDDLNYAKSNLEYIFEIEISGKQSLN